MTIDSITLAHVRGATHLGRLRHGSDHRQAVERWRRRQLVHYHISVRSSSLPQDMRTTITTVHANARVLAAQLPQGSIMIGLAHAEADEKGLVMTWCVHAMPGLKLPAWTGFTIVANPAED